MTSSTTTEHTERETDTPATDPYHRAPLTAEAQVSVFDPMLSSGQARPCEIGCSLVFYVEFTAGYGFRQLVEFSRKALECLPLFFGKHAVTTCRGNGTNTLVTSTVIRREDLTDYYYNSALVNTPGEDEDSGYHVVNMKLTNFHNQIRSVGKKEGVRLFQYHEHPGYIFLQFFGGKTKMGWVTIRSEPYVHMSYDIQEDKPRASNNPNCTVSLADFCGTATTIARLKYENATFRCFAYGAHIFGGKTDGDTTRTNKWGNVEPVYAGPVPMSGEKPSNCFDIHMSINILGALAKMANFNPEGIVRIYCSMDNMVRLEVPLGCFATTRVYIINHAGVTFTPLISQPVSGTVTPTTLIPPIGKSVISLETANCAGEKDE